MMNIISLSLRLISGFESFLLLIHVPAVPASILILATTEKIGYSYGSEERHVY